MVGLCRSPRLRGELKDLDERFSFLHTREIQPATSSHNPGLLVVERFKGRYGLL
jgi:hypothetical protein